MIVKITQDTTSRKDNLAWYMTIIGQTIEVSDFDADNYITTWMVEPHKDWKLLPKADTEVVQ
jgi:hypothetical protein